ncbi:hypothetical protein [Variovorax gossypii]
MDKRFEVTETVRNIDPDFVEGDGFSWRAALLGAAAGVGGEAYLNTLAANVMMWVMQQQGYSQKDIYATLFSYALTPRFIILFFIDLAILMAAGRVAASFAPSKPYLHAAAAGVLATSFIVIMMVAQPPGSVPTWYRVMALCMPLGGCLLGALSWGRRGPLMVDARQRQTTFPLK